jgi:hypothetical protein
VSGEERELVKRQRPTGAGGQCELHALAHPAQRALDRAGAQRASERGRARHAVDRTLADDDDQPIVAQAPTARDANLVALGVHGTERSAVMGRAKLSKPLQRHPRGRRPGERVQDGRWPLHEVRAGGEQLDRDAKTDSIAATPPRATSTWSGGKSGVRRVIQTRRMSARATGHRGDALRCGFPAHFTRRCPDAARRGWI